MDAKTRQWMAVGLLLTAGGIAAVISIRRLLPKLMRGMMQSMMNEMMKGEEGLCPPEMCRTMMKGFVESEPSAEG